VNEGVLQSFVEMGQNVDVFGSIRSEIVKLFVDLLLNQKDVMCENEALISGMKDVVKKAIIADSKLERQITKGFSRRDQNHFRTLFN
jgi:hypothetical protein